MFDSRQRSVTQNGEPVQLSPKAFLLLQTLIEARPAPVAKEVLYDRLWPKTFVEGGNLHNLVAEVRRALEDGEHRIVRTAHGVGYSFDARDVGVTTPSSRFVLWIHDEIVHLRSGESIIGRDPESAVIIDTPDVSRQHVRLFVDDDRVVIEDLGSKNGTFIGSERLSGPRIVRENEDIIVGRTKVLLRKRGNVASTLTNA